MDKDAFAYANIVSTEGIEVQEVREEDISIFDRNMYSKSDVTSY
jgi:hypothetical protein